MKILKIWNDNPSDSQARTIANALSNGQIVIIPTDTLYGIACDALNTKAISRLCQIKGLNPAKTDLSIICSDISMASQYCRLDNEAFRLLRENTPGPFTFILPASSALPKAFKGRKTVGIRIPESNLARQTAAALGHPLLTTSILYEDNDHAVNPELIAETYRTQADLMAIDGEGSTVPSTIVDCTGTIPEIVRTGKGILH